MDFQKLHYDLTEIKKFVNTILKTNVEIKYFEWLRKECIEDNNIIYKGMDYEGKDYTDKIKRLFIYIDYQIPYLEAKLKIEEDYEKDIQDRKYDKEFRTFDFDWGKIKNFQKDTSNDFKIHNYFLWLNKELKTFLFTENILNKNIDAQYRMIKQNINLELDSLNKNLEEKTISNNSDEEPGIKAKKAFVSQLMRSLKEVNISFDKQKLADSFGIIWDNNLRTNYRDDLPFLNEYIIQLIKLLSDEQFESLRIKLIKKKTKTTL